MKWVTFLHNGELKPGILALNHLIVDLQVAEFEKSGEITIPDNVLTCIELGEPMIEKVKKIVEWALSHRDKKLWININDTKLAAPIPRPQKNIFCIGKNYIDHAIELGSAADVPEYPIVFSKPPTTVTGPDTPVLLHAEVTNFLDYEGELAVVIGKTGKAIQKEKAFDHVFGYTIINDISARDIQSRHKQYLLGKSLDTGCPMGPCIVDRSEIHDPHALRIETKVNGEVRQCATTGQLIFDIPDLIATISAGTTLEAGDIIATGTPAGVGKGMKPPQNLRVDDVVEITIEGIGVLKNTISDKLV